MNKGICIICLLLSLCLCSCSANSVLYSPQEGIEFNYNNISAYNDFWLTNESICYLEDTLIQNYCLVAGSNKKFLCSNSGNGFGKIQNYDSKIYMLDEYKIVDEYNSEYRLKVYNVETDNTTNITTIKNCDNFLVLNEDIFYLQYSWNTSARELSLRKYSVDSDAHTTIYDSVLSFGVIGNDLFYVSEKDNVVSIFQYDAQSDLSVKCGEFTLDAAHVEAFKGYVTVSYTADYVIFICGNYQEVTSTVWTFSLKEKTASVVNQSGCITSFVSYDKCSYFAMYDTQEENVTKIFKMTNGTNETFQIGKIKGDCSLFVGSDAGVYVLQYNENVLTYFTDQNTSKTVCKF